MKFNAYILMTAMMMSLCLAVPAPVFAQYELKELTPAVKTALDGRKERFGMLATLKQQGVVGENNSGYVTLLKDDGSSAALVDAENRDRKVIYTAIAEQNGLLSEMKSIEKVFAQVQREKADSGEMVQLENGEWSSK